jgi:hypothetical protein
MRGCVMWTVNTIDGVEAVCETHEEASTLRDLLESLYGGFVWVSKAR